MNRPPETIPAELGRYQVDHLLGAGAHGEVYRAWYRDPGGSRRIVALKVLCQAPGAEGRSGLDTLLREARLGEHLRHPNIVGIHGLEEDRGVAFLAMEYVEGVSLRQLLSMCEGRGVNLPEAVVCEIGAQVCDGLAHAHDATGPDRRSLQLVHQDLKPSNLLLDRAGVVRIADFGVATSVRSADRAAGGAAPPGTPAYMAPEQLEGGGAVSPAADLYALGLVLCESATDHPVFTSPRDREGGPGAMSEDVQAALLRLHGVAPELVAVLRPALENEPERRYMSARAMGEALRERCTGETGCRQLVVAARLAFERVQREPGVLTDDVPTAEAPVPSRTGPRPSHWGGFVAAFSDRPGAASGTGGGRVDPVGDDRRMRPAPSRSRGIIVALVVALALATAIAVALSVGR